jgi:hypothetical protein
MTPPASARATPPAGRTKLFALALVLNVLIVSSLWLAGVVRFAESLTGASSPHFAAPLCDGTAAEAAAVKMRCPSAAAVNASVNGNGAALVSALRSSCLKYDADALAAAAAGAPTNVSVSVVIGAFMRPLHLALQISALRRQRFVNLEIVLVDGGSWPPLVQQVPGLDVDTYIYRREDGLYHRVRMFNEGVAASSHDVILQIDDDIIPGSDYWAFSAVVALRSDPRAGLARLPLHIAEFRADLSDVQSRVAETAARDWTRDAWHGFTMCNVAVRRSMWLAVGGFDPARDGKYGSEDTSFHKKSAEKGYSYTKTPLYGCALHVGLFFGNRDLKKPTWR